jgi:hypothetical protein
MRCCGVWTCAELSEVTLFTLASQSLDLALALRYQNCAPERGFFGQGSPTAQGLICETLVFDVQIWSAIQFSLLTTTARRYGATERSLAHGFDAELLALISLTCLPERLTKVRAVGPWCAASFLRRIGNFACSDVAEGGRQGTTST